MQSVQTYSTGSPPLARLMWPHRIAGTLWTHRGLLAQMIRRSVASRYRGSVLGPLWALIVPLMMLAVYTFVFGVVMKARWGMAGPVSVSDFALILFAGLVLYTLFAETVGAAANSVVSNAPLVKKVVFPLEILPVISLGGALVNALISFGVLLLGIVLFQQRFPTLIGYLPLVLLPLIMLALGVGWFVASLGVYLRDTAQVIAIVLQMLIFLTPVFYSIDQMPQAFQQVMLLNPLSTIVESGRDVLMHDRTPNWPRLMGVTLVSLVIMQLGYAWFMKTKRGFADVL